MKIANAHIITKQKKLVINFLQKIGNNNLSQHYNITSSRNAWCARYVFFFHLDFLSPFVPKEILGYFVLP
jgi:hypothetical protein